MIAILQARWLPTQAIVLVAMVPEQTCSDTVWDQQRRTFNLSNGQVIWDIAGNAREWIDWNVVTGKASPLSAWAEINATTPTASMPRDSYYPLNSSYNYNQAIGEYWAGSDGTGGAAIRGGSFGNTSTAGIYSLALYTTSSSTGTSLGFRCSASISPYTYTLSGRVTLGGQALAGVSIDAGALSSTITDTNGRYSFTSVPSGLVIVYHRPKPGIRLVLPLALARSTQILR